MQFNEIFQSDERILASINKFQTMLFQIFFFGF